MRCTAVSFHNSAHSLATRQYSIPSGRHLRVHVRRSLQRLGEPADRRRIEKRRDGGEPSAEGRLSEQAMGGTVPLRRGTVPPPWPALLWPANPCRWHGAACMACCYVGKMQVCCTLHVARCMLHVVCCALYVAWCMLQVCWMLHDAWCMLQVCWMLHVAVHSGCVASIRLRPAALSQARASRRCSPAMPRRASASDCRDQREMG